MARTAINSLKFRGHRQLASFLSRIVTVELEQKFCSENYDYLIPIPLHIRRQIQRGYNQTFEVTRHLPLSWRQIINVNILKRIKHSKPTSQMTHQERVKKIKNSFSVINAEVISGKRILIFDDIVTTRSTVNECARILKKAGASKVDVLTIAVSVK